MAEVDLAGLKRLEAAILNVLANTGTGDRAGARKRLRVAYEDADLPAIIDALERDKRLEKTAIEKDELLELAWGLIANAGEGSWEREHPFWVKAAERWRDRYHAMLRAALEEE